VYIPLSISIMMLGCKVFSLLIPQKFLAFIGGISLEIYLVHAQFVLRYLTPLELGYVPTLLLLIAISLPLAWLLKRLTERILP